MFLILVIVEARYNKQYIDVMVGSYKESTSSRLDLTVHGAAYQYSELNEIL